MVAKKPVLKKTNTKVSKKTDVKKNDTEEYMTSMYRAYFGDGKAFWYKQADEKYSANLGFVWSWWAFCFPFLYLLVRKAYIAGIVAFLLFFSLLGIIPVSLVFVYFIVVAVCSAMLCPYFVLQKFKKVKSKVEFLTKNETERLILMACKGGKNYVFLILGFLVYFLTFAIWVPFSSSMYMMQAQKEFGRDILKSKVEIVKEKTESVENGVKVIKTTTTTVINPRQ